MDGLRVVRGRVGAALAVIDGTAWVASIAIFCVLRLSAAGVRDLDWGPVLAVGAGAGALQVLVGSLVNLYRGRAPVGSLDEASLLASSAVVVGSAVLASSFVMLDPSLPRSVPVAATCLTLAISAGARGALRRRFERVEERRASWKATPALILGAGPAGRSVIDAMLANSTTGWRPVGLLDDDADRSRLRIRGVPVLGTAADLADVARQTGGEVLVIATPYASADRVRATVTAAQEIGLKVKVLPGLDELPSGITDVADLRDLNVEDLLGRHVIDTDIASIAGYLRGKRVLVTGAGGSIGSELCRQIRQYGPAELIMLDRDESALHAVQLSLEGRALLDSSDVVLADIRDKDALLEVFRSHRPEVVFHAAALKHLPMLEQYPGEAVKTNVWGTLTVLEAALAVGVERFVNVSTDKAADPICVLGYSKRLAECLTAEVAAHAPGVYLSVRFGNVLGSRGSVLTTFASQIANGGPVTVTHPDVTRYFMTIPEAVQLVIQAAAIGEAGEVLVLDMGDPVRIRDVADQMMVMANTKVPIEFTGLRPGEKLHEDLLAAGEVDLRPRHPMVSQVPVPTVPVGTVLALASVQDPGDLTRALAEMCAALSPLRSRELVRERSA